MTKSATEFRLDRAEEDIKSLSARMDKMDKRIDQKTDLATNLKGFAIVTGWGVGVFTGGFGLMLLVFKVMDEFQAWSSQ